MYCHLAASFGWTWEYIDDHMTIPRMVAINAHQARRPPQYLAIDDIRRLLAAYMGVALDGGEAKVDNNALPEGYGADGTSLFDHFPPSP